jgi:hypothetical protein
VSDLLPSRACQDLCALAESHHQKLGPDALYIFLKMHECICKRVAQWPADAIVRLNDAFVGECIRTYHQLADKDRFFDLHEDWQRAYRIYKREGITVRAALPFIAAAHIKVDLCRALGRIACTEPVDKSDYDSVFPIIIRCIETVSDDYGLEKSIPEMLRAFAERVKPAVRLHDIALAMSLPRQRPKIGLRFRILVTFASIPRIRNYAIQQLREYAWNAAEEYKNVPPMF